MPCTSDAFWRCNRTVHDQRHCRRPDEPDGDSDAVKDYLTVLAAEVFATVV